ncbi:MAG: HlyD family efflux transporter periplasmic adaptor subunit [Rhodobacteraceae bacterium]|jgi:HlyD family secretion protein|nr:HlyD family efflux transporter periplasmic adaptor subunit [Paracoccaceae bacterium]
MKGIRAFGILLFLAAAAAAAVWAFWPDPVAVDEAQVVRGPLQVTVAAEGVTRVREPFLVVAPTAGTAARAPVEVGDRVVRGQTVVALIEPAEPAILDARARAQGEAAVAEAEAALRLSEANVLRAEAELAFAEAQHERNRELAARGIIAQRMLEDSERQLATQRTALAAARSEVEMHRATLARARALLVGPSVAVDGGDVPGACCVTILAPQTGTVLSVASPSARLVQAGEALLTIGDLADLEVEVDLLSADAVRVAPGARAFVERWGGPAVLEAEVRRIEPAAFTRVSALGIEEQRVRVRLDFLAPPEARAGLGDRFRVFVRIVLWQGEGVLQVPVSALFRQDGGWAVYRIADGRAVATPVTIGQRTSEAAEVVAGLVEGDRVVAFPGDRVQDGARVAARPG